MNAGIDVVTKLGKSGRGRKLLFGQRFGVRWPTGPGLHALSMEMDMNAMRLLVTRVGLRTCSTTVLALVVLYGCRGNSSDGGMGEIVECGRPPMPEGPARALSRLVPAVREGLTMPLDIDT